jgi:hypothetical protein
MYGSSGIPGSLLWTIQPFETEDLDIIVSKIGLGLQVSYARKKMKGAPLAKWPAVYSYELADNLEIAFGAVDRLPYAVLMQFSVNLTSPWDGNQYGTPWQVYLNVKPWRNSETGDIVVEATPNYPADGQPHELKPRIPRNAAYPRTFSSVNREKDI